MKIYVGTSGFAHKEWKGTFYPEKISAKDMLGFYAGKLGTVEINNTFYHMPKESVLASWAEQVPDGFLFALKAPQRITHIKRLRNVSDDTAYLLGTLSALGPKQGPLLFQFPKSFRADKAVLEEFLPLIPERSSCAFDFRSPTWMDAGMPDMLREKGLSLCIEDTDEARVENIVRTASWGYLRLRRSDYTDADLADWLERIRSQKWEEAYVFFKHEEEARGAQMALRFRDLVESKAKAA